MRHLQLVLFILGLAAAMPARGQTLVQARQAVSDVLDLYGTRRVRVLSPAELDASASPRPASPGAGDFFGLSSDECVVYLQFADHAGRNPATVTRLNFRHIRKVNSDDGYVYLHADSTEGLRKLGPPREADRAEAAYATTLHLDVGPGGMQKLFKAVAFMAKRCYVASASPFN